MAWVKHFRKVSVDNPIAGHQAHLMDTTAMSGTSAKFSSYLPEVYAGHPNRIQRYYQFHDMSQDSDIDLALDVIADFCTQSKDIDSEPFEINYNGDATEVEVELLTSLLKKWVDLNNFRSRLWRMFRETIKNGDQFFLRDPETFEWLSINHFMVEMVKVDETTGKEPDEYVIRGLDYNKQAKFATKAVDPTEYRTSLGNANTGASRGAVNISGPADMSLGGANVDPRQKNMFGNLADQLSVVDAKHVIHLSLSVDNDINWPFGQSILESVFKTYKQKELLEDAVIIYRVQRAPERRIFYIDTGNMPTERARAYLERAKNEIHQRRIPNRTGGGQSSLDVAYNPLCLDMATRVPLLDGRTLSIFELSEEYNQGKENWVYSCDPITGEIMPGNITWAGLTRQKTRVLKITLDNGESITCTPDHKIPVLGKGFVEAQYLTPEDSLIAFNTRLKNIDRTIGNVRTYTQVFDHKSKKWVYVHRMVGEFFRKLRKHQEYTFLSEYTKAVKQTIHHKDYDRYNNDPQNLIYMNKEDHIAYHGIQKQDYWEKMPKSEAERIKNKISESLKDYYSNLSEEKKYELSRFSSTRSKRVQNKMREENPEKYHAWKMGTAEKLVKRFAKGTLDAFNRARTRMENGGKMPMNQTLNVSTKMLSTLVDIVKKHKPTRPEAAEILSKDKVFLEELKNANPILDGHTNKIDYEKISPMKLDSIVEKSGYEGWRDFTRKIAQYNHRIVSIEYLDEPMDVGTLTIDGNECWHNHHTFAVEAGIFVKNSMMDDYFFAVTETGRGSKVEVLPGGENVGEILDLTYFSRKLARGLRVPSQYLSIGPEENNNMSYNDGKLGASMIQEFRFNKYCTRLQNLLAPAFDIDFKKFVSRNGVEVSPGLFDLRFCPPQSFSEYRELDLESQRVNLYASIADNRKISERVKMKRYLGWTEDEVLENEKQWREENASKMKKGNKTLGPDQEQDGLSSIGVRPGGDMGGMDDFGMGEEPAEGDMNANPSGGPMNSGGGMEGAQGAPGGDMGGGGMGGAGPAPGGGIG